MTRRRKLLYEGKTKTVYACPDRDDLLIFHYKDTILGDGDTPDSGGNKVIGKRAGKGRWTCRTTVGFFDALRRARLQTHFSGQLSDRDIVVIRTERIPLEVIWRNRACGTYLSRNPGAKWLQPLKNYMEFSLKSDRLGDPFLTEGEIVREGYATAEELRFIRGTMPKINRAVVEAAKRKGLMLIDFKAEFGRVPPRASGRSRAPNLRDGAGATPSNLIIIDEISPDTARFARRAAAAGRPQLLGHKAVHDIMLS